MNLNSLFSQFGGNVETLLFGTAMHYFQTGSVDTKHLDADAMALSLTAALAQVEKEHPGIAEKYGWAQIADTAAVATAIASATAATNPTGLLNT
jgi:hypothetical protein